MGYLIGAGPLDPAVKRYNGGTSSFTMDNSGTTNGTLLWVDGVAQVPGTDYNVSGTTITTTTAAGAGTNNVTSLQLFNTGLITTPGDNTVATAKIQDDAVTLAKMAAGTDGQIITYDASGNPAAVGPGSDGQVLTSTGAGSPPAFEDAGGGAWEFVSTQTVSGVSSVSITGIDNTSDLWIWVFQGVNVATDGANPYLRTSNDTSSHSYDSTSGDYSWCVGMDFNTTYYSALVDIATEIRMGESVADTGNDATAAIGGFIYIHNPSNTTYWTGITFNWHNMDTGQGVQYVSGGGQREAAEAVTAVQFYMSSGNVDSGRFSLYKLKHS
jgi:hypothetical protein